MRSLKGSTVDAMSVRPRPPQQPPPVHLCHLASLVQAACSVPDGVCRAQEAVDNAAVMLFCVSLAYKESANCRLEASYGHQQEVSMIPLMMERGYRPTGWLGLLLGTRV